MVILNEGEKYTFCLQQAVESYQGRKSKGILFNEQLMDPDFILKYNELVLVDITEISYKITPITCLEQF